MRRRSFLSTLAVASVAGCADKLPKQDTTPTSNGVDQLTPSLDLSGTPLDEFSITGTEVLGQADAGWYNARVTFHNTASRPINSLHGPTVQWLSDGTVVTEQTPFTYNAWLPPGVTHAFLSYHGEREPDDLSVSPPDTQWITESPPDVISEPVAEYQTPTSTATPPETTDRFRPSGDTPGWMKPNPVATGTVSVQNAGDEPHKITIAGAIVDGDGAALFRGTETVTLKPGQRASNRVQGEFMNVADRAAGARGYVFSV